MWQGHDAVVLCAQAIRVSAWDEGAVEVEPEFGNDCLTQRDEASHG